MLPRSHIVLNADIVQQAMQLSNIKTKHALIDAALKEFIAKRQPNTQRNPNQDLLELQGEGGFDDEYDYKATRARDFSQMP